MSAVLLLCCLLNPVFSKEKKSNKNNAKLPFTCPNRTPEDVDLTRHRIGEGGGRCFPPNRNQNFATETQFREFQAAVALTPCTEEPIAVCTRTNYFGVPTVTVIHTDKDQREKLENWLK